MRFFVFLGGMIVGVAVLCVTLLVVLHRPVVNVPMSRVTRVRVAPRVFVPGDHNFADPTSDGYCNVIFEVGPQGSCALAERVARDYSEGILTIRRQGFFVDQVPAGKQTLTFDCSRALRHYTCTSETDPQDFFLWETREREKA